MIRHGLRQSAHDLHDNCMPRSINTVFPPSVWCCSSWELAMMLIRCWRQITSVSPAHGKLIIGVIENLAHFRNVYYKLQRTVTFGLKLNMLLKFKENVIKCIAAVKSAYVNTFRTHVLLHHQNCMIVLRKLGINSQLGRGAGGTQWQSQSQRDSSCHWIFCCHSRLLCPTRMEGGSKRCLCLSVCLSVRRVHSE